MITSLLNRQTYAGTGSTGPFGFTFKIFNPATDLKVTKLSALAIETSLVYLTDYTVVGIKSGVDTYGAGGTITLNVALAVGESLTIRRVPPNVQGLSVQNAGPFFPKGYEDHLDYLVMLVQAHEDVLSRVLQMKETTDLTTGISPVLPTPSASMLLGWDATGKKVVNTAGIAGPAGPSVQTFASAAARDAAILLPTDNQQVELADIGYRTRFSQALNRWVQQALTRAAGPVVGSKAVGCKADGITDDAPVLTTAGAFGTAITTTGTGELDVGVHLIGTACTIPGFLRPLRGSWVKVAQNVTLLLTAVDESVDFAWIDLSLGGNVAYIGTNTIVNPNWYKRVTTALWTPPVPKTGQAFPGPAINNPGAQYGDSSIVANHNYRIATTRQSVDALGVARETGPGDFSPAIVGVNSGQLAITPEDPGCGLENGETGISIGFSTYVADMVGGVSTTVGATVLAGDATITGAATGSFPSSGFLQIDNEWVYFAGVNNGAAQFTGCIRGVLGSAAAGHAIGATILQIIPARYEYSARGTSDGHTRGFIRGWGDLLDHLNATPCGYDGSKPIPPAPGTTGLDCGGSYNGYASAVVKPPPTGASAPIVQRLDALQPNGQYDFQTCWEYGDGSCGPLGTLFSGTIGNYAGHMLIFVAGTTPWTGLEIGPPGAHFLRIYGAKHNGTLRLLKRIPAGPMSVEIHDIPDATDTPARAFTAPVYPGQGACISVMSPVMLAARSIRASGGARCAMRIPGGVNLCEGPLPLDADPNYVNQLGEGGFGSGLRIFSRGGLNGDAEIRFRAADWVDGQHYDIGALAWGNGGAGLQPYVCVLAHTANNVGGINLGNGTYWQQWGSKMWEIDPNWAGYYGLPSTTQLHYPGRPGIINTYPRLIIQNVRFTDPNAIIRYGLRMSDYSGGGSQYCYMDHPAIDAEAPRGICAIADSSSGGENSHTCSEFFLAGGFYGGRRAVFYFSGGQTGNVHFDQMPQLQCGADAGGGRNGATSAVSYVIKHGCPNGMITGKAAFGDGGQYKVFLTDTFTRDGGNAPIFSLEAFGAESHNGNGGAFGIFMSSWDANGAEVRFSECGFQNSTGHAFYDMLCLTRATILSDNCLWANIVVLDNAFAEIDVRGGNMAKLVRTNRFYAGGQAPAQGYPRFFKRASSGQFDALQLTPLVGGTVDVTVGVHQGSVITSDTSTGNRAVVIPSALYRAGQIVWVKKITADANTVTISSLGDQSNNGKLIDGAATYVIPGGTMGSVGLWSDGTNWRVLFKF